MKDTKIWLSFIYFGQASYKFVNISGAKFFYI